MVRGLGSRIVAVLCLLGFLLPMLPSLQPAVHDHPGAVVDGFDAGARLAVDAADQPTLLGKLLSLESGDSKRVSGGGSPAIPAVALQFAAWDARAFRGHAPAPDFRVADNGIRRGDRSPTGPPVTTA